MSVQPDASAQPAIAPTKETSRTPRKGHAVVALLLLLLLVNFADKVVVGLAGVDIRHDLGIDNTRFGVLQSSFFWLFAVGSIAGGLLSRRIRARWLLVLVAAAWAIVTVPMAFNVGFTVMLVSRALLGLAEGPTVALAMQVVHSWFPANRRTVPTSVLTLGAALGPAIASPLLTYVITNHSWRAAFAVLAVAALAVAVLWAVFGREGHADESTIPTTEAAPVAVVPDSVPMWRLLTTGTVLGFLGLLVVTYADTSVKLSWLPLYLRQGLGYDATAAGRLNALPYLGAAVTVLVAGIVSRLLTKRGASARLSRGILAGGLVTAGAVATLGFASMGRGPAQALLLVVATCCNAGAYGLAFAGISDVVPHRQRGAVLGIVAAVYSVGAIIAPVVVGRLVDVWPTPSVGFAHSFQVLGIALLVGGLLALAIVNPERDAARLHARYRTH